MAYKDTIIDITSDWNNGDDNWDVANNANLNNIRALLIQEIVAISNEVGAPNAGELYIVGAAGTGDFVGMDNMLAFRRTADWVFSPPAPRTVKYNIATSQLVRWNEVAWVAFQSLNNIVEDLTPELGGDLDCLNKGILKAKTITFNGEIANTGTGAQNVDFTTGQKQKFTITGATTITFVPPVGAGNFLLKLINAGANITWATTILWKDGVQPTWSVTGVDIVSVYFDGTNYHCTGNLGFAAV